MPDEENLKNILYKYVDSIVTIYTEGCDRCHGFTGLLSNINDNYVKIVTCSYKPYCSKCHVCQKNTAITILSISRIVAITFYNSPHSLKSDTRYNRINIPGKYIPLGYTADQRKHSPQLRHN